MEPEESQRSLTGHFTRGERTMTYKILGISGS
jgi:hypothetical protein